MPEKPFVDNQYYVAYSCVFVRCSRTWVDDDAGGGRRRKFDDDDDDDDANQMMTKVNCNGRKWERGSNNNNMPADGEDR